MYLIEAVTLILLFAVISVPIANRLRLPLEVFLVMGSCLIGLILQLPHFEINPMVVFNIFLPIILFYAAYFSSLRDFKTYKRAIIMLSIGLVIFTMAVVAYITKLVLPALSWSECFLLGAIISPTDASAATTIIRKLNAPKYMITILEAESLFNDATALILFRFALVAIVSATFSLPETIMQFFIVSAGGLAIGLIVGTFVLFLLLRIHSTVATTTLTFITAIGTYMVGEYFHVSSVVATVACGIYFGIKLPELSSSQGRIQAKTSWDTLIFIINSIAFTLIGLELPVIMERLPALSTSYLVLSGVAVTIAIILARIVWIFASAYISRWLVPSININDPMPSKPVLFLLGWCGMRGIVSLAAVLSIPALLPANYTLPHLNTILFITYFVIAATLIIPAITLPIFVSKFKLQDKDNKTRQEALARLRAMEGICGDLERIAKKESIPADIVKEYKRKMHLKLTIVKTQLDQNPFSTLSDEYRNIKTLTLAAIDSEKRVLLELRKSGEIHDEIFHLLFDELDREEMRAQTLRL